MTYSVPSYIHAANVDVPTLRYVWDDTRASQDFRISGDDVPRAAAPLTLHAKIALGIGIYEWIVWRFDKVCADRLPIQVAQAAWCANVDRRYMEYFELDREEWLGPVRGPLWCAITWLLPMIHFSDDDPVQWESGLSYLPALARHVLPTTTAFESWLQVCLNRLAEFYPQAQPDPFDDLFGEREEQRRGPLVAREALDPGFQYRPMMAVSLLADYLRSVDYGRNPLLRSPVQMREAGFEGTPYDL